MEIKGLSDERVIEFLSKSPVKNFDTILDVLNYLEGKWFWADIEYELFDWPLGDNEEQTVHMRVPNIGGIAANALLSLAGLLQEFRFVTRRVKRPLPLDDQDGLGPIAFYKLTNSGRKLRVLLMQIDVGKQLLNLGSEDENLAKP